MLRLLPTLILALLAGSAGAQLLPIVIDGGGGGGGAAPDWSSTFVATYEADNSATASGGSCSAGTDCDLTANDGATFDATNVWSGTHAFALDGVSDAFSCANATCDELTGITGSVTAMCAMRPETGIAGFPRIMATTTNTPGGFLFRANAAPPAPLYGLVADGTDVVAEIAATNLALDTWAHGALVHDATADTITLYLNGVADCGGACATQQDMTAAPNDFVLGANAGNLNNDEWTGQLDECGVYAGVIGPESMCRVYCCGINGEGCDISGTSWSTFGRCTDATTPCNLPTDASQAAPGTN